VEEGDISLNQHQTIEVHAVSKIVNHALTQIALAVTLTGTFWIWKWHCCIWNIRFQLNSCQLQISVEKSDIHNSIQVTLTETFRIWNWHSCIWNTRFQVNSCHLQIYVEDSDFYTSICILPLYASMEKV
jgi:hypothetical protein